MNVKEGTGMTVERREIPRARRTRLFAVSLLRFAVVRAGTAADKTSMLDIMRSREHAPARASTLRGNWSVNVAGLLSVDKTSADLLGLNVALVRIFY